MMHITSMVCICIVLLSMHSASAQTVNVLTPEEFENITINNRSIKAIRQTEGDELAVQNLFGSYESIDKTGEVPADNILSRGFIYNGLRLGFTNTISAEGNLSRIEITSSAPTLRVNGTSIKVGDPISKLGDVDVNQNTNGTQSVLFAPHPQASVFLSFDLDSRNVVKTITFLVLT